MNHTLKAAKYIHIVMTNSDGKWKSITLHNLAKTMGKADCKAVLEDLEPKLIVKCAAAVERLVRLEAPELILDPIVKQYEQVQLGKHSDLNRLRKRL